MRALLFMICFGALSILTISLVDKLIGNLLPGTLGAGESNTLQNSMSGIFLPINVSISFVIYILTVYGFCKLIDKRTLTSLGLQIRHNISHGAVGFFLALLLLGLGTFILIANNNLHWSDVVFDADQLYIGFGLMLLIAFSEELAFRGYILNNLMQSINKWLALLISAVIFAVFHSTNPGIAPLAILNIFLAGVVLGINYIYTKNLWFGILFHFCWNFYQGPILGFKVSGVHFLSLLEQELYGHSLLTGGPFGFEGSIIDAVLSVLIVLILAWVYRKKYEPTASGI